MRKLAAVFLAAWVVAGCGALEDLNPSGLACSQPAGQQVDMDDQNPTDAGHAFAGRDVSTMTTAEIVSVADEAGVALTWRWSYGIGAPGVETNQGYAECWCVPPPSGRVTDLAYDSVGRVVVFVDAGENRAAARPQPRLGWGCEPVDAAAALGLRDDARL